jgi:hypothetical protein
VGLRHARIPTDQFDGTTGNLTVDQQATTLYSSLTHRLTSKITGTILGQFQHSMFEQGTAADRVDNIFLIGLNLG